MQVIIIHSCCSTFNFPLSRSELYPFSMAVYGLKPIFLKVAYIPIKPFIVPCLKNSNTFKSSTSNVQIIRAHQINSAFLVGRKMFFDECRKTVSSASGNFLGCARVPLKSFTLGTLPSSTHIF